LRFLLRVRVAIRGIVELKVVTKVVHPEVVGVEIQVLIASRVDEDVIATHGQAHCLSGVTALIQNTGRKFQQKSTQERKQQLTTLTLVVPPGDHQLAKKGGETYF